MKNLSIYIVVLFVIVALSSACEDVSDMALDRVAAPLLGVNISEEVSNGMLKREVIFYELDKSGILDQTVGIDSIPVSNLAIEVYLDQWTMLGSLTTDANGVVVFEKPLSDFGGTAPALQWAGSYKGISFRIPDSQLKKSR